jgi:hypothetical protein
MRNYDNLHEIFLKMPRAAYFASLDRLLNSSDSSLRAVAEKALQLNAVSNLCLKLLPGELRRDTRVANLKQGVLTVLASNPAVASKLRLCSAGLAKSLSGQGVEVSSVSIRVQPNISHMDAAMQQPRSLSPAAVGELSALCERLRPSPAKDALRKLLDHQAGHAPRPERSDAPERTTAERKRAERQRT